MFTLDNKKGLKWSISHHIFSFICENRDKTGHLIYFVTKIAIKFKENANKIDALFCSF